MGLNCSFTVKAESLEEVTKKALEHVREKHTSDFNTIRSAAEIERMEKALAASTHVVVS
jgi:predicted small metal-binding protein